MATTCEKRILIVEDDDVLGRLIQMRLASVGYATHLETHGRAALTYAADAQVDLAILDVNLPDITGYQVAKELRRITLPWEVPILMLTVRDQPVDQLRGFAYGADAYLTKPFDSTELLETVALLTGASRGAPFGHASEGGS